MAGVRVYTLPVVSPGRDWWPWVVATPVEWRKARRHLGAGRVRGVLADTGAYRLMVRGGRRGYPGGWLRRYLLLLSEAWARAEALGAGLLYVVPDVPGDPWGSALLARYWLRHYAPLAPRGAVPVLPVHLRPGRLAGDLEHYRDLIGEAPLVALAPEPRGRPSQAARVLVEAARLLDGRVGGVHVFSLTLRLARVIGERGQCIPGLASADTSSWYYAVRFRGWTMSGYMERLQAAAERISC